MRRVRRWGVFQGALLSIMGKSPLAHLCGCELTASVGSWASYTAARYFIAYRVFLDRRSAALPLGISSILSVLLVIALVMSFILPYHIIERRPQSRYQIISTHHILQFLLSFFLFAPTVVNLVLVCVWRNVGSGLSLRGRCHWSPDAVWVGVGGQCATRAPAWGVWLTAAILRLILTAVVLVRYLTNKVIAYLTYELCRSHIISRREVIVHYGCQSAIVPRTSGEWTLSRYPR